MSYKRLKQRFRKSSSKLHQSDGDIIRNHPLTKPFRSFQEYPVPNSKYFVDWFMPDLKIAIEVAGQQHEKPVAFDGNTELAKDNFIKQVDRDKEKHRLIQETGWKLVEIWHDEVKEDIVINRIMEAVVHG